MSEIQCYWAFASDLDDTIRHEEDSIKLVPHADYLSLLERFNKAKAALARYADEDNYDVNWYGSQEDDFQVLENHEDGNQADVGDLARTTLKELGNRDE